MLRNALLFVVMLLVSGEALAYATWKLLPDRFPGANRPASYFHCNACANPRFHRQLGWNTFGQPADGTGIRQRESPFDRTCGAAFGDSFTYGNDLSPDESYSGQLSRILGCEVANYGVGAYSYVQAYDKLLLYRPKVNLVVFTVYEEMLKRALSASTLFYSGQADGWTPRPYISFRNSMLRAIPMPATFDDAAMKTHHRWDYFAGDAAEVGFPFLLSVPRALLSGRGERRTWQTVDAWSAPPFGTAFQSWLSAVLYAGPFADRVLLVLLPSSTRLENWRSIDSLVSSSPALRRHLDCIVTPGEELAAAASSGSLLTETEHFNTRANAIIAGSIARGLQRCATISVEQ